MSIVLGDQQSPIIITESDALHVPVPQTFFYPSYSGKQLSGHLAEHNFIFTQFESINVGGQDWTLRRLHFHNGAEHKLAGKKTANFEVHLLHTKGASPADDPRLTGEKLGVMYQTALEPPFHLSLSSLS